MILSLRKYIDIKIVWYFYTFNILQTYCELIEYINLLLENTPKLVIKVVDWIFWAHWIYLFHLVWHLSEYTHDNTHLQYRMSLIVMHMLMETATRLPGGCFQWSGRDLKRRSAQLILVWRRNWIQSLLLFGVVGIGNHA